MGLSNAKIQLRNPRLPELEAVEIDARLSRLVALGLITLPTRRTRQKPKPIKISGPPVSKAILDDRR